MLFSYLRKIDIVTLAALCVILASDCMHALSVEYSYISLAVWMVYALLSNASALKRVFYRKFFKNYLFYCVILIMTSMLGSTFVWGIKLSVATLLILAPPVMYLYYVESNKDITHVSKCLTLVIAMLSCYGAYMGYLDDNLGRNITAGDTDTGQIVFGGVAMASGAAVFAIYIISQIASKQIKLSFFVLVILLTQFALVVTSGSTISTVLLMVFVIFAIVPASYKRVTVALLVISVLLLVLLHDVIGRAIIEFGMGFTNYTTSERFVSLGSAIAYGSGSADSAYFFDRIDRPLLSFSTFFSHPIFGVSYQYGNDWNRALAYGVGCHGEWADALARFGIFAIVYFNIFKHAIKDITSGIVTKIWFYLWIALGILNPVVSVYSSLIMFFILPSKQFGKSK